MRKHASTILLILIFCIGLTLMLYPTFADYWNSFHQSRAIAAYSQQVASMDDHIYDEIWDAAMEYNQSLIQRKNNYLLSQKQKDEYHRLLNIGDNGVMGVVDIPSIQCTLPIYHGTDDSVLQVAVGHLEWTSLPVGGESSHCVLSGHRGLPSARLFTDLDRLAMGDVFYVDVLGETLTYEVEQIRIVEPEEVQGLEIIEGEDLCTLITCTPYGINSHRLLVRGHRIDPVAQDHVLRITADGVQIEPVVVAPFLAAPILLILLVVLLVTTRKRTQP